MKIAFQNESDMILFLKKEYIGNIKFNDISQIERKLKSLFLILKKDYNITLNGFYEIKLFHDNKYGIILKLQKDEIDYLDLFDNQVDMRITIDENSHFLYLVDDLLDIPKSILAKCVILKYNNQIYLSSVKDLTFKEKAYLLEFALIVYEDTNEIIEKASIVPF